MGASNGWPTAPRAIIAPGLRDAGVPHLFRAGHADRRNRPAEDRLAAGLPRRDAHRSTNCGPFPGSSVGCKAGTRCPAGTARQRRRRFPARARRRHRRNCKTCTALAVLANADRQHADDPGQGRPDDRPAVRRPGGRPSDSADEIFRRIETEYHATVDFVLKITGQERLLDNVPVLQGSIQRRNPYVDPLSFIQLVLLKRLCAGEEPRAELLTACWKASTASPRG